MTAFTPFFQALDGNGDPYSGAKLNFYITATSTPKNTYSDAGLTTPNTNPVVADSAGRFGPIYLATDANYKAVLTTSAGATIATFDPLQSVASGTVDINGLSALTAPATADELPIYDASAAANKKITLENMLKVINSLTEDTAPDMAADFLLTYDASAGAVKKALANKVGAQLVATLTASSSATLDYASLVTGIYLITFNNIRPATDATDFGIRFSASASFLTSNYSYQRVGANGTTITGAGTDTLANGSYIQVCSSIDNGAGSNVSGHAILIVGGATAGGTTINGRIAMISDAGSFLDFVFSGRNTSSSQIDGIRFYHPVGGNITSGTINIWRLV